MKRISVESWLSALSDRTGDDHRRSSEVPQLTKFDCELNESNVYIAPFNKNLQTKLARWNNGFVLSPIVQTTTLIAPQMCRNQQNLIAISTRAMCILYRPMTN